MARAHRRRRDNKAAGTEGPLTSSGLHASHETWVVMTMKGWELNTGRKLCHVAVGDRIFETQFDQNMPH